MMVLVFRTGAVCSAVSPGALCWKPCWSPIRLYLFGVHYPCRLGFSPWSTTVFCRRRKYGSSVVAMREFVSIDVGPDVPAYDVFHHLTHDTGEADRPVIFCLAGGTLFEDWRYVCCVPSGWQGASLQWLREDCCQHWCQLHRELLQNTAWYLVWPRCFTGVDLR